MKHIISNLVVGLDDEEQLDDIVHDYGQFLVQFPPLGPSLDGKISITRDFVEDLYILLGSTKKFEHFHIQAFQGEKDNLKLQKG